MPNHCFYSTVNFGVASESEFTVAFNADMSDVMNYSESQLNTAEKTDEILCDIQRTNESNMHQSSDYS